MRVTTLSTTRATGATQSYTNSDAWLVLIWHEAAKLTFNNARSVKNPPLDPWCNIRIGPPSSTDPLNDLSLVTSRACPSQRPAALLGYRHSSSYYVHTVQYLANNTPFSLSVLPTSTLDSVFFCRSPRPSNLYIVHLSTTS